jgi:hypothetical protein
MNPASTNQSLPPPRFLTGKDTLNEFSAKEDSKNSLLSPNAREECPWTEDP